MKRLAFIIFFLMCLTSCQKQNVFKKVRSHDLSLQESVARFLTIPDTPFSFVIKKVVTSEKNPNNVQIFYECKGMSKKEVQSFYIEEMERLGWNINFESEGAEILLEFVRPSGTVCVVSCRDQHIVVVTII